MSRLNKLLVNADKPTREDAEELRSTLSNEEIEDFKRQWFDAEIVYAIDCGGHTVTKDQHEEMRQFRQKADAIGLNWAQVRAQFQTNIEGESQRGWGTYQRRGQFL